MKKIIAILGIIILILAFAIAFLIAIKNTRTTGEIIESYKYSYTKAICNKTNYCEDYEIHCDKNNLVELKATGAAVQMPKNWKDPRENNSAENLCS